MLDPKQSERIAKRLRLPNKWVLLAAFVIQFVFNFACAIFCLWYNVDVLTDISYNGDEVPPKMAGAFAALSIFNLVIITLRFVWQTFFSKMKYSKNTRQVVDKIYVASSTLITLIHMIFGATALLLLGKEGYKSTNKNSATSRNWLVTTCLAFIFMNIVIQVFAQGFLCLLWCVEHDTDSGLNEDGTNMKIIGHIEGGDAPGVTKSENMEKLGNGFVFKDVKDAWTMTPKPRIHDTATSPPSPSWYHPPPPPHNTPVDQRDVLNDRKEIHRRNRMISVDPVGAFVGGVRTSASGLEITADDLDVAKKKLRSSLDSTGSAPANIAPKLLPVVFEDIFKETEGSEKSKAEAEEIISEEYERNEALGSPADNADQSDKQDNVAALVVHVQSNSDLEEGADDVFIGATANGHELPLIEIHAEPQQVQCYPNPQFEELSDSSKNSTEDLIANFYGKLEDLEKCGYRPIDQRSLPFASDMGSKLNSVENANEGSKLQGGSPNNPASNLEMTPEYLPRLPSSSPPKQNVSSNHQSAPE